MSLVAIWCTLVSVVFYLMTFPFNRKKWLSWAYARSLNVGVKFFMRIKINISGKENMIKGPAVIIMNHQSNFDPLLQGPVFQKNAVIIGKKEMVKVPLWGRIFKSTNNILVDRRQQGTNSSAIDLSVERLRNDDCYIWIFPEGTRSQGRKMKRFKFGAFKMAIEAQVPIIPMVTQPLKSVLDTQNKTAKGGQLEIKILPAINTHKMGEGDLEKLVETCEGVYKKEMSNYLNCLPEEVFIAA